MLKTERKAKIRNRYNQVSRPTLNTTWESDKTQETTTHKSDKWAPYPAGDHKAADNLET